MYRHNGAHLELELARKAVQDRDRQPQEDTGIVRTRSSVSMTVDCSIT